MVGFKFGFGLGFDVWDMGVDKRKLNADIVAHGVLCLRVLVEYARVTRNHTTHTFTPAVL